MRIGNLDGQVVILTTSGAIDIGRASGGRFGPDPQSVYDQWAEFTAWAAGDGSTAQAEPFDIALLDAPSPAPRQVFGIGLNYRDHAQESGLTVPDYPSVFTKFPSSITGPHGEIELPPDGHTDWEVELVAVIGAAAHQVAEADAWSHIAGLTAGQDISERITQMASAPPQFSMGKSFPRFGPTGPWLVTVDEFARPDDLELGCAINGEEVQKSRTRHLIISVPQLIAKLSAVLPLLPGDLIFTGTPAGVGALQPGDRVTGGVDGVATFEFVVGAKP